MVSLRSSLLLITVALAACGGGAGVGTGSSGSTGGQGIYPQDVTVAGYFSGHISSGYGVCIKTAEGFQGFVQDSKAGSPLRFDFNINTAHYHGAGTYGPTEGSSILGTVYMGGQIAWTAQSGTFTINRGEKTGSVRMHLATGASAPGEDLSGNWRCG